MLDSKAMTLREALSELNDFSGGLEYIYGPIHKDNIMKHVKDELWQEYRLKMKGHATRRKMQMLGVWFKKRSGVESAYVQVTNYINALKRGGQISG